MLQSLELSLGFLVVSRVVDLGAIGQCSKMDESEINSGDLCAGGFGWGVLTDERDVVLTSGGVT